MADVKRYENMANWKMDGNCHFVHGFFSHAIKKLFSFKSTRFPCQNYLKTKFLSTKTPSNLFLISIQLPSLRRKKRANPSVHDKLPHYSDIETHTCRLCRRQISFVSMTKFMLSIQLIHSRNGKMRWDIEEISLCTLKLLIVVSVSNSIHCMWR